MPTISCISKIDGCLPCDDFPILNVSSESADLDRYISRFSFLNSIPPIRQYPDFDEQGGGIFLQVGCMRWCWSTVSQDDADDCARRQAVECAFNPLIPGVPMPDAFHPNRIALYYNDAVAGTYTCPDGNVFSYTIAANQIVALTQGEANAIAFALAKLRANQHRVCISNMDDPICVDTWATKQITANGPNVAVFPATDRWELVSGTIPDGMTLETGFTSDGIALSGIPTTIGEYSFRVRVTISTFGSPGYGDFMEKVFTVKIVGIAQSDPLPDAVIGVAYSQQLTASGSTSPSGEIWSITSGSLPHGLSLSAQGLIEGTPTGSANTGYSFTVQAQFPVGGTTAVCSKSFSITTTSATIPTPVEYWSFNGSTQIGEILGEFIGGIDFAYAPGKVDVGNILTTSVTTGFVGDFNNVPLNFVGDSFVTSLWFKEVTKPTLSGVHDLFDASFNDGATFKGEILVRILPNDGIVLTVFDEFLNSDTAFASYDPGTTNFHLMVLSYNRTTGLASVRIDNVVLLETVVPVTVGATTTNTSFFMVKSGGTILEAGSFVFDELSMWMNDTEFNQGQFDALWNSSAGQFYPFPS